MKYSLSNYLGMFPRYQSYLIDDMAAQLLVDGNIISGGLEAFRRDYEVYKLDQLYKDMYLYKHPNGRGQWLLFDHEVDLVRSAVIDDSKNQMFITGFEDLRTFDSETLGPDDKTITKDNSAKAGITRPTAPSLSLVEGKGNDKATRAYLIAYARHWDSGKIDLGPTSDAATTSTGETYVDVDETHVAKLSPLPLNPKAADEKAYWIYIYRASVTSSGQGQWRYVTSFNSKGGYLPKGVTYNSDTGEYTFTDEYREEDLGEVATNLIWSCPEGLQGIINVGNGVFAAYKGNTVYLSEPYQGHAFPAEYAIPLDYNVVGLGSFGNTLVICTESKTYTVVVSNPAASILRPIQEAHACVSKNSIVSMADSVIYATAYGLIRVTGDGATRLIYPIISDMVWTKYNPSTIRAAAYQGKYLMFFDTDQVEYNGCIIDFEEIRTGIIGLSLKISCLWQDDSSSNVYVQYIDPDTLIPKIYIFGESTTLRRIYKWRSKKFVNTFGLTTMAACKVNFNGEFDTSEKEFTYEPSWNALNVNYVNMFPINGDANTGKYWANKLNRQWCILDFYADDKIRKTLNIYDSNPVRLPAGFRADSFYVDITSTMPISRVQLATSFGELE